MKIFVLHCSRLLLALTIISLAGHAHASECGLSCCIAAGVEGVGSATGLTVTTQYDLMNMKTIKQGTTELTSQQARTITGTNLAVPTKMVMQKFGVNVAYRMDEDNAFVFTIPYIINDMDMLNPAGMPMTMPTISGLGDVSLIYLRDVYKDADIRTRQRFSIGVGLKAPSGKHTFRNPTTGELVHMMMQAGTGSWDALLIANGTLAFGEHEDGGAQWLLSPSLTYQLNSRNNLGYKVGDRLNYDLSARYRITSSFNVKLDLNGVWAGKDSTDGSIDAASPTGKVAYQNPMSLIDNVANTGINSLFLSPGFQWVATPTVILSGEYRMPIYQNTGGIQQVTDSWYFMRASFRF
ncbi:MAG TPA: hypothetical protein VKA31_10850 [Mariprofundaceae bacterium]|nr:hypothetical protein [Mariprofundaceae bacterium]